jgi:hypothetical protein
MDSHGITVREINTTMKAYLKNSEGFIMITLQKGLTRRKIVVKFDAHKMVAELSDKKVV